MYVTPDCISIEELRFRFHREMEIESEAEYQEFLEKLEEAASQLGWERKKAERRT